MTIIVRLVRQYWAALRVLLVMTAILGIAYPLLITGVGQIPGLAAHADGSLFRANGHPAGSTLIGQSFADADGQALPQYFQPRPSAAGDGDDPTATSASNLGPESVVDVLPDPNAPADSAAAAGKPSLLTQVCTRSREVGLANHVSGARPFCTDDGVGAVLGVFWSGPGYTGEVVRAVSLDQACPATPFTAGYRGVKVQCATFGADYARAQVVPIRGDAPSSPAVPADAVTASGSGLDPDISPAYAALQTARVAAARDLPVATVTALVARATSGRALGFLGEPTVNVVEVNRALDAAGRG